MAAAAATISIRHATDLLISTRYSSNTWQRRDRRDFLAKLFEEQRRYGFEVHRNDAGLLQQADRLVQNHIPANQCGPSLPLHSIGRVHDAETDRIRLMIPTNWAFHVHRINDTHMAWSEWNDTRTHH
jgi:predicted RNA-binding Zn ribbon-like protein